MIQARLATIVCSAIGAIVLTACGGGGGGTATVGGTVTGLANGRTLVMQNNLADDFSITGNGANSFTFNFATGVAAGNPYNVTVLTQPVTQTCTVTNGTGNVSGNGAPVTTVAVACATTSTLVGNLTGLAGGAFITLTTTTSASQTPSSVTLTKNGQFSIPGLLPTGTTYTTTITQAPNAQTCTVANGSGTIASTLPATITVGCQ